MSDDRSDDTTRTRVRQRTRTRGAPEGRPEEGRPEEGRPEEGRPNQGRPDGGRAEGGDAGTADKKTTDKGRADEARADGKSPDGGSPDGGSADGAGPDGGRGSGSSGSARRRRSRRRGRQRRRQAGRRSGPDAGAEKAGPPADGGDGGSTGPVGDQGGASGDDDGEQGARDGGRRRSGGGGRSSGRGGGTRRTGPRRGQPGVSEETRRAISEGPPRRMLVTEGEERTEIAVLEERDLVEHYVTRKADVSYVGNIYLGRVQNVLPGMEAAFVDIGKGRNGVLYAREVDHDDEDYDGNQAPRIEQTLKPGQTVLVQVTKDPMGTKGARLTQHLSIAGRFCVLAPGDGMLGISRKLPDDERDRLRKILKSVRPDGYGLIVRTAAEGATQEQLEADVTRLTRIWNGVEKRAADAKPLEAVYEEPSLVIRVIRDIFGPEYTDVVIDSEDLAGQVREYLEDVSPEMVDRVSVHTGEPLFRAYEVTNQVRRALEKKVWLASGGYLIIEKTEAMWVIDVNTGRFVGKSNLEETVLRNNLEAADEIARQLRLRDMGGIIVIDFVDMMVPANRDEVLKRFKRELARDKTKSRVMDISKLGLVQMTRKNVSQGLTETFTTVCDCCEGRGAQILDVLT